jgi:hypothetical protein
MYNVSTCFIIFFLIIIANAKTGLWTNEIRPGIPIKIATVITSPGKIDLTVVKKNMTGKGLSDLLSMITGMSINFPPSTALFVVGDIISIQKMADMGYILVFKNHQAIQVVEESTFAGFDAITMYFETNLP